MWLFSELKVVSSRRLPHLQVTSTLAILVTNLSELSTLSMAGEDGSEMVFGAVGFCFGFHAACRGVGLIA